MSKSRPRRGSSRAWSRSSRLIVAAIIFTCVLIVAAIVKEWPYGDIGAIGSHRSVRGVLVDVQGVSIVFAESVTLRGEDGVVQTFLVARQS